MKRILIIFVVIIVLGLSLVSCAGSKICPAYSQDNIELGENANS